MRVEVVKRLENITESQRRLVDVLLSRDPNLMIRWSEERGVASVLRGRLLTWESEEPKELFYKWIREFGPLIGPTNVIDNCEYVGSTTSTDGHTRIRAMQTAQGLPIWGATLLLFADKQRGIFRVQSGFYRDVEVPPARIGAREVDFSAREANLVERLRKRLEADPEGARFVSQARNREVLGVDDWARANFPLTQPPKMWLYPTGRGLRQAFKVSAYQPVEWSNAAGIPFKTVDVADLMIDARTGRIISEGARLGMSFTDTNGDGLSTLKDNSGSYISRPLLVVQEDGGDFLLINRTHTPHIITHNAGGSDWGLENKFKNDTDISRDSDRHWNQTTTSCSSTDRNNSQQPETDGHSNAEEAWTFYDNLGWRGFDNGRWGTHCPIRVAAHIGIDANAYFWRYIHNGKHYGYIAFYDGECSGGNIASDFIAGDPAVFAHEYQHAITYFGAMDPSGDPGYLEINGWHRAIHEGLSDSLAGLRTGQWVTPGLWPNGVTRNDEPFRRIEYPRSTATKNNQAYCDHYDDQSTPNNSYVNSTILSHAAFLAGQGGVHQRKTRPAEFIPVVGVGRERIAEIFHYAVTEYFDNIPANTTDGHTMIEAARFILDAAEEVTGSDRTCEYIMLRRAFYAVGLYPYDDDYNKTDYGGEACMLPWTIAWKYSQPYIGFPALWYHSPDLFINNGSGPEYDAIVGQENKLFARVRNIGDKDLSNIQVKFHFRTITSVWKACCDQAGNPCILNILSLSAGSMNFTDENNPPADQAVNWYIDPVEIVQCVDDICVRAEIVCKAPNHDNDCSNDVQSVMCARPEPIFYQYAIKFICGKARGDVLAPGDYWTAINVHNPTSKPVKFRKKIAIALPGERPGPVTKYFNARLGPDQALEIDRKDIFRHAERKVDFLKGFVIIESEHELDVVAVYTAAGEGKQITTLQVERVCPRPPDVGKPDLIPVPNEEGSFCKRDGNTLIVTVKNQGTRAAGTSVTAVDFGRYGKVTQPTPSLAPNASVDLSFPIPRGCHDPDCEFDITVDADDDVNESDEGNNTASGSCVG